MALGETAQRVAGELSGLLNKGGQAGQGRLPAERVLAAQLGVARNTVRQALAQLEAQGLLVRQVGRGTFAVHNPAGSQGEGAALTMLADASPADILEVRQMIEPQAAALAAVRGSGTDFRRLREVLDKSLAADQLEAFEQLDADLHYAIFEATRNAVLMHYCAEINAVRKQPAWFSLKKRSQSPARRATYNEQHRDLVEAICARNPDAAARVARAHVSAISANLLGIAD